MLTIVNLIMSEMNEGKEMRCDSWEKIVDDCSTTELGIQWTREMH